MPRLLLLVLTCWVFAAPGRAATVSHEKAPNVVLVVSDAMRADMLAVNGNREVQTPNLDKLASEGINFTRAYCSITTTTPSFSSILSSLYPMDHKAYSNTARISLKIDTLPEILKRHGWHTAGIVNFRWLNQKVSAVTQGIDEFAACKRIRKADKTNRWVLQFLRRRKSQAQPFFLLVHYIDTHTPYYAPASYTARYYPADRNPRAGRAGSLQKIWHLFPKHNRDNPYFQKWLAGITDADYVVATNKGAVSWVDGRVGQIIEQLKKNGQWQRTVFIFTADHGESLGEHGLWFLHGGLYESTARVPLIVHFPGQPGGRVVNAPVQHVDLMPTLLAYLGLPVPPQLRGRNLWAPLQKGGLTRGEAYLEHAGGYLEALVTMRYKYIHHRATKSIYPSYPMRQGTEELYDLEQDAAEARNLAAQKPDIVKRLRNRVARIRAGERARFERHSADVDEQTEQSLRSLGYL